MNENVWGTDMFSFWPPVPCVFAEPEDAGASSVVVYGPDGTAVAVTSSINS